MKQWGPVHDSREFSECTVVAVRPRGQPSGNTSRGFSDGESGNGQHGKERTALVQGRCREPAQYETNGAVTVPAGGRDTMGLGNLLDLERKAMEGIELNLGTQSWLRAIVMSKA